MPQTPLSSREKHQRGLLVLAACLTTSCATFAPSLPAMCRHQPEFVDPAAPIPGQPDKWRAPFIPQGTGLPDLNVGVVNFAVQNLGNKIGDGECWTLAQQALINSGAQRPLGYVFGRELMQNEPWMPGDIIQFTTCTFVDVQPNRRTTFTLGEPNHTAIIHSIFNGQVMILQQNVNRDKRVQVQVLNFPNMTGGTLKVYRPLPAGANLGGYQQPNYFNGKKKKRKHSEDEN